MYQLTDAFIPNWTDDDAFRAPAAVDTICPHCGLSIIFELEPWSRSTDDQSAASQAACPSCSRKVSFFAANVGSGDGARHSFFMHPAPDFLRQPLEGISEIPEFDESLQRAYAATVNIFNSREWTGTAVVCRRTMEDIAKSILPADQQKLSLALQIEALPRRRDLSRPILQLSEALKRSGSLGAYFDLEKIPNEHTASLIMNLLDYLIEYLFILPERIQRLHSEVRSLAE